MRTNVLNDLSNVVKKGTILAGSAAASVDSCAAGSTTLAEYPGNHPVITRLSPRNHPLLDAIWKHVAMIFAVLVMSVANIGTAWGANGDVLFNQGFGSATEVAYSAKTERSYSTSSTLSGLVGTGDNLFQGAQCTSKDKCGIAINTTSGANSYTTAGTFQAYANNTGWKWALYKTTNFATTAPTAIKFEMDVTPKYIANKQAVAVVVGSGFSVGTSAPAANKGYTGFNIITNNTGANKIYIGKVGGTTTISTSTGMKSGTKYHITWVINATGEDLTYTGPDSKSYTLATAKWDMWVGTTRIITGQDRAACGSSAYTGTTMQNLYIGNDVSGKHEVIIDNVKVTDLTPDPCAAADLTASNITSNGDQEAGTGITFSKVGTPASGDTWYWQTSATGTDQTYSASSSYTTATTAGSYTVYLRAFNTDCWGKAASMTNTIYPAPSAMIHNTFAVNAAWSSRIATQDKTNITSLNAMAAVGESVGSESNKSGLTQKIPSQSSEDATKYMSLSFNVASGKQLNVTSVVFDEQPVTGTGTFKVSISDNQGSTTKTQTIASDAAGTKHTLTLNSDIVGSFKGTVTVKVWAYGWSEGYRFGDYFYINGTVTSAAACEAPNHVDISGNYHFFPGETLALTATAYSTAGTSDPIAAGDITGYQWQKYIGSDWEDIVGETSATYTKANATTSDVGQYRCIVSTGATCSTTSGTFNAKCLQLYVYWDNKSDKCNLPFTKVDGTHATVNVSLENGSYTYYYKVTDGCGNWWGNDGTMTSSNCSGWNLNVNNHCGLTTTKAAAYTFNLTYNAGVDAFSMSVVYPSTVQPGGYNLYFANDERNWSNIHYRIGRTNWNSKAAMTLVSGTANLYQTTTIHYESDGGFEAWHIANNGGWSDGNSIYKTNTGDGNAITNATSFEGAPVPSTGLTVIPGSDHSTGGDAQNNNCEFYSYTTVSGMLTRNVAITAPTNGSISIGYTDVSGTAQTLTSGNADLAHTCILTITATPATGYQLATLTVNGAAHTSGNTYILSADATVAATFTAQSYAITYKDQGNVAYTGSNSGSLPATHTYGAATALVDGVKSGYTFGGWYTTSDCTGAAVTSLGATAYTAAITLYAKWTEVATLTALECNTLYKVEHMVPSTITLSTTGQYASGLSANTKFEVIGDPAQTDDAAGTPEMKNEAAEFASQSFTARMYLKGASNTTGSGTTLVPTSRAIKFIVSTSGTLDIYAHRVDRLYLKKAGDSGTTQLGTSTSGSGSMVTHNVTAGTYYIYATNSSTCLYGIRLNCCSTPDAPTAFTNTAVTSSSATFSITDAGNAASYDLYYASGSPATPTAETAATENVDTKTPTITGLDAETTYTIWVRSVCDASHKSSWVALTGSTFTTEAAAPAGDCITIAYFDASQGSSSSNKPDNAGKYLYGYTNSAKTEAYAYTITTGSTNNKGQGTGASDYLRVDYGSTINIYADHTTTGGTPANFSNVTSVSVDFKMNKSSYYTTFDIFVGSTKIANNVSLEGAAQSAFTTFTYNNLEQLNGKISIVNKGAGSTSFNFHIDNIQICTSSLPSCTTPVLPDLTQKTVCEGGDADAAWNAAITNSLATGETVAYSWVKKGSSTVLSSVATYQPTDVTEAMAGTYVVTATVSADGKASKSASKEVELAVNATVEISSVTQSPATVYAGNSVTLTATANVSATWQWYTCTNAEGDGESSIGSATSAAYAFTAPASAGTYYYKVKATGPCGGVATEVYALTVSAATGGDCDTYYFFANAADATTNSVTQNEESFFSGASEGTNNNSTSITVDENSLSISKRTSAGAYSVVFTVPTGATATLYTNAKANSNTNKLTITRSSDSESMVVTDQTALANYTLSDIPEGTWTLSSSGKNWYYGAIIVKVCTGATCTDPAVTASVSKSNVCAGSGEGVTFTASDAHADASYQWQKQNGSAWEDISEATATTYTIPTVEASHAGKYRVVASHECDRISNELTLTVATTPVFGDLGGAREVETGGSLSITNVEATSATSYKWYKSANATYDSGSDEQVGTSKNLMLPVSETAGSTFYLFCVASNACTSTVSDAITVSVIAPVEKDCAVAASNGENFTTAKTSNVNSGTYNSQTELHMNNNNKYIYYVAATGYHFETATVNCCAGDATALTQAAYSYSTDGGETWTDADLPGAMTNQYSNHVVNLPADVNAFRVGRVLGDHGVGSNTLYVHEVCFTYVADCNATTIAISNATPSYDLSVGGDFTEPTCTVKQGGTTLSPQPALRYSSFNEAIAIVDPSTGEVDFTGTAGSVMIMASYDGDETYCESSATYTITVSCGSESAPKIVAGSGTNLSGCNAEVNLVVKDQSGNDFASGSYQWYRDGEEIDGATSATYTANRTGTYTVSHTGVCTQMSTNSAVVTSESFDPSVERLVPFQYYHANKNYTDQMKMRHLFAVTSGGDYEGKRYYMTATRNGAPLDITTSTAFSVRTSEDNRVDSVMIDLNKLKDKFNAGDEIVLTCAAIADCGTISAVTENIEIHVIDNTPTLALICSGTDIAAGTRNTKKLTVGGDFLTGYNVADLCQQTGEKSFDANTEWGLYTRLKENYIVTPVNGYAVFNKLNYEPFDILLLTDYPKASKSTEAALILDDMYELCDYRPMLSFKTHMVQPADKLDGRESHWKKKGFTTLPEAITKGDGRLKMNIVCYAHPMFDEIKEGVANDYDDESQIVYTMLSDPGHEGSKGMQGFHLAAAENFVTIGLVHFNATATDNYDGSGNVKWTPESDDEMLVAAAERQTNLEARFILFSLNCGAQSKLTAQGNTVVLKCLEYLLNDATIEGNVADCALTFDNKAGDNKWSNKANWAPKYSAIPGEYNSTRIAAPATVDLPHAKVMSVRIKEGGSIYIPAGSALDVKSTVRHKDVGSDVRPTDVDEIHIGSSASGNGTLIFNNNTGDTKARVDMYSNAQADITNMSAATSKWQYIGTPHTDVANARSNYYGSWLYQYSGSGWEVIPNGGPLEAFHGYCITNETAPIVYDMEGTLAATTTQDIAIPDGYTVIANSWTAPIDISTFTDDDMENISDKTIYFFNTGTDAEGDNGTGTEAGTYVAVPKNSASYVGTWQIPSMQGFYISTTSAGTLHLDYDRHVRPTGSRSVVGNPMYAPRRAAAESEEPNVLKIFARGSRYQDKLVVLEREDFTRGYDSGWDGEAWGGGTLSPMVYVTGEGREDAVSAIPEFEGTVIAFKAGEDNDYHFDFIYDGEESLYLFDTENNTYTQIMTGESYYFSADDKAPHSRFILTRRGPQIATGIEPTSDSSLKGRAKKLLIENKMYILLNGALYDATGKAVK